MEINKLGVVYQLINLAVVVAGLGNDSQSSTFLQPASDSLQAAASVSATHVQGGHIIMTINHVYKH